jgi:Xaa-Pro dipeptidase
MQTRRDFLAGAAVALGASHTAGFQTDVGAAFQAAQGRLKPAPTGSESEPLPAPLPGLPSQFSLEERNRRWSRVRAMMRDRQFDALLTPAGSGEVSADSQYLTQLSGWVVFPLDGAAIVILDAGERDRRMPAEPWTSEVRTAENGSWSSVILDAMRAAKLQDARVGVGRLADVLRNNEGDVPFTTLDRVRQAFPRARFQSASDALVRVKLVRSAEEIAVMEKATAAGELAIEAMRATARPGAIHKDVWLAMFTALTAATGETPSRLAVRAGNEANTSTGGPMLEVLKGGQIMNQEIAGRVLGYMAQVNHSICVGSPPPSDWLDAANYCVDVFHELVDWVKPGRRFIDLCQRYVERAKARSPELSPTWVLVHTCGFGDGPRMGYTRTETTDLVIEPSMVFTLKPRIPIKGTRPAAQFGDPILVTANGARRLGRRKLGPVAAGVS